MENFRRCRICISESAVMMSIFGEDALWRKISYFANVQIEEGDSLPQQICVMCAKNAINAFSFKQKCEAADSFFRKQLREKVDDIISISSGEGIEEQKEEKFDKYRLGFWNFGFKASSPILVEDSSKHPSECNDQDWTANQNAAQDDNEQLPLIPEIELITPNDDDKKTADGYQCSICFEFFAMKSILKHHVKIKHPEANPTFECFECKKTYLSKRFLDKHIRRGRCVKKRKNQSRVMQCTDCHESFPSGHHLGWHKRSGSCPSHKQGAINQKEILSRNNFTPVPIGQDDSESEEEQPDEGAKTEKENSLNVKKSRRKKWTKSKRKGRSRIRLDSDQIELAKQLIRQDASSTKIAQELKISRTYAWKLRKSLDLFSPPQKPKTNHPNGEQSENKGQSNDHSQGHQTQALNLSKKDEPPKPVKDSRAKGPSKPQENGQPNSRNEAESADEEEGSRRGDCDDDSEATESADESRQDGLNTLGSPPRPSCSQNSLPLGTPVATPTSTAASFSPVNSDTKMDPTAPPYRRRPRKPNVFMTPEKYEQAKQLVAHRATTMEVAKHLNISQMSAWKLRDNILKGIPMTFKPPPAPRPKEPIPKINIPRQRLKGVQRRERDRQITEEILTMLREDNTIQYWKVSEKLAEKGLHLSPSSVCQRLKAMGIHRRWKTNDPQKMDDNENDTGRSTESGCDDDNSSSICGTTDTSQFLSTSFLT